MKKVTLRENIKKCGAYARKMPKSIKESLTFETDEDIINNDMSDETDAEDEPTDVKPSSMNVEEFVDHIRKESLKGMAQYADSPDSREYMILKKIWQLCDKKPEDQQSKQGSEA